MLRDLPIRQPERLAEVSLTRDGDKVPFSYPMFREFERGQRVFTGLIGVDLGYQWQAGMFNVEVNGILSQHNVHSVTGNYYSELGVVPLLGRLLAAVDVSHGEATTSQVAVISYEFWQRHFGGAPDVVGKQIRVERQPFTIIGVTRKWFTGLTPGQPPEVTIPITAAPLVEDGTSSLERNGIYWVFLFGRLKPGVNIEQAQAQLRSLWPGVLRATDFKVDYPEPKFQTALSSMPLDVSSAARGVSEDIRSQFTPPLFVLAGIVGLILLVACVNLANLMLARAAARSHEMSVRVAIGASRWSLVRQVLTESLALSLAGASLGLAFAYWGVHLLVLLVTQGNLVPVSLDLRPDLRVLSLTGSLAILTGTFFGLAAAWRCSHEDPATVLQQSAHSLSGGASKLSKALIMTQVALSLILLLGAGLLIKSFEKLRSVDLGFQKENVLEVGLYPRPGGYQNLDVNSYHKQLIERISSIPGVLSVAYANNSIVGGAQEGWRETVSPASADSAIAVNVEAYGTMVSPSFFRTLGIPLLRGREFEATDDELHPRIAIVSSSLAERLFPNGEAIGKRISIPIMRGYQNIEIVGIAGNARILNLRDASTPILFLSELQTPQKRGGLVVRTKEAPEAFTKTVGLAIESLGHEYPLWTKTITQVMSQELVEARVTAMLSGFFAVLALLLASIGLYGLMSYTVTRRTREIGIRVALGAQPKNVLLDCAERNACSGTVRDSDGNSCRASCQPTYF